MADPVVIAAPSAETPAPAPAKPANESVADGLKRLGWNPNDGAAAGAEPRETPPAGERPRDPKTGHFLPEKDKPAAGPAPAPPRPAVVTPPGADKLAQVRALAAELGLEFDNGRVSSSERADFRKWKAEQRAKIEAREAEVTAKVQEIEGKHKTRLTRAEQIERAADDGDYDGLAKLLNAKDWNDLQRAVVDRLADPNYKKLRELEQWKAEQAERERKQAEQLEQQRVSAERQQAIVRHINNLSAEMAASKDPLVAAYSDDPAVLQTIYRIQEEQFDGERTVSAAQALRMSVRGAKMTLMDELRSMYNRGNRAFGAPPPPPAPPQVVPAVPPELDMKRPAPKSQVVPSNSVEPSPKRGWENDREYSKSFQQRIQEAADEDRRREEEQKRALGGRR